LAGLEVAAAYGLDLALGDPVFAWHPIRLMGRAISKAEEIVRIRNLPLGPAGWILALGLPLVCWAIAKAFLDSLPGRPLISAILIYFCLSTRDLAIHAWAVLRALESGNLDGARQAVSRMVGRDTADLDSEGVTRACLESVAESTCDGVVAPLFYAFLGGAPLALAYKAISTLDSMVGHKNERYLHFGRASALLDDLANWIPARLSALLTALSAALLGLKAGAALRTAWKEARTQPSPNSGWPEAAFAGALEVRLGGPISYGGQVSDKPTLGEATLALDPFRLRLSICLMACTSFLALILGLYLS
jgi:adenosylcobinamide-phosphate synthase